MREIKFRAVMPDEKVKGLGFKLFYQNDQYLGSFLRRANTFSFDSSGHDSYGVPLLEQFTGLKDKNGVEIYEGDIVRCGANEYDNPGKVHKVVYSLNSFVYVRDDEPDQTAYYSPYLTEVIGNVHESPDLLK